MLFCGWGRLGVPAFLGRLRVGIGVEVEVKLGVLCGCAFLGGDEVIVEFGEIGEVVDDDFPVVVELRAGVVVEPENLEMGEFDEMAYFAEIGDGVLAEVELLRGEGGT
jgi:hypothetical protein